MEYFEVSAKENINIHEMMTHIMDKVYDNMFANKDNEDDKGKQSIVLGANNTNTNKDKKEGGGGSGFGECCSKWS